MICNVCGNDQFDCDSGMFYCTLCQTQSQDKRVEEAEEDFTAPRPLHSQDIGATQTPKKRRREWDKGRPWMTHEAWTLILRQQIDALIKLGADPRIDKLWQRIWFTYLAKCGVAFCTEEQKQEARNNPMIIQRSRDKYPGTIENPFTHMTRKWRTMLRRGKCLGKKMANRVKNDQEMEALMRKEEFTEEDREEAEDGDPQDSHLAMIREMLEDSNLEDEEERPWMREESDEEEEGEEEEGEEKEKVFDLMKKVAPKARTSYERHPSYMTLPRTMTFLCLTLMHSNPLSMPHDIIRWIENGEIPFNDAASRLPSDMKFSAADTRMFTGMNPYSEKQLRLETGKMMDFIGITKLPTPDLQHLASRYVIELKLPGDMHQLIVQLMSRVPLNPKRDSLSVSIPPFGHYAMAVVVLMLKLLFGLNDHTERELSEFAKEVNACLEPDHQQLFVWSEWISAQEAAGNFAAWSAQSQGTRRPVQDVRDVGAYLHQYYPDSRSYVHRRSTQNDYVSVLDNDKCKQSQRSVQESLSLVAERLKKKAPPKVSGSSPDWSCSTLSYVTDGVSFLENINDIGLSADTLHSLACSDSDDDGGDDDDEEEYVSSQDMFDSPACKRRRLDQDRGSDDAAASTAEASERRKRRKNVVRNLLASQQRQQRERPIVLDVDTLAPKLVKALESYHRYKTVTSDANRKHRAYERVVNMCASRLGRGTYGEDLEFYVQRVEMLYMDDGVRGKYGSRAEFIRRRFMRHMV